MKNLKSFEFTGSGSKSTYDWSKLMNGQIWQLEQGKDFTCKPETFMLLARKAAKKAEKVLKITKVDGGVVLQAVSSETETAPTSPPALKSEKGGSK